MPLARSERSLALSALTSIAVIWAGAVLLEAFDQPVQKGVKIDFFETPGQMQLLVHGGNGEHAVAGHTELRFGLRADGVAALQAQHRLHELQRVHDAMIAFPDQRRVFLDQLLGLKSGGVFRGVETPQLEQLHDLVGHQAQERLLGVVQLARLVVEDANRAERKAFGRLQQRAGIKTQMRLAGHQRVVDEAPVQRRVRNDEQPGLQNGVRANRAVDRRFTHAQSDFRLEPLAAVVDQIDDRNRRPADRRRHLDDLIEFSLAGRIENAIAPQRGKAELFSAVQFRFHRPISLWENGHRA